MTKVTYIPNEIANAAVDEHGNRKPVTRTHHIFDDAKNKNLQDINEEIYNDISLLINTVESIDNNIDLIESDVSNLGDRVQQLELNPSRDSIKHIFMTQSAYDALETYEEDTLYLIIEHTSGGSRLGEDTFPLILG